MSEQNKVIVDIGSNLTGLLERLASTIGTTADKVFPWYVKQQIIEGWVDLFIGIAVLTGLTILLLICSRRANWDEVNAYCPVVIVAGGVLGFAALIWFICFSTTIAHIMNPEYGAINQLLTDLGNLR